MGGSAKDVFPIFKKSFVEKNKGLEIKNSPAITNNFSPLQPTTPQVLGHESAEKRDTKGEFFRKILIPL